MPYVAKHLLCTPFFTCHEGKPLTTCPPELLKTLIKDGLVEMKGEPDEPMEGLSDLFTDPLSNMSRKELLQVYVKNDLRDYFTPMKSWSDEQLRTTIRSFVRDTHLLELPEECLLNVPEASSPVSDSTLPPS